MIRLICHLLSLCVHAGLLVPGIASANAAAGAETRVVTFGLQEQVRAGVAATPTVELHRGCALAYGLASDSLLVPRGTTQLSKQAQKSIRSFETNIAEHRAKLEAFKRNPDAFDNKGF